MVKTARAMVVIWAFCAAFADGRQALAVDNLQYCNVVQAKVGFVRYPLGTIGVWSTELGEVADVMTRVPRIYPCVNAAVLKDAKDDWRASMTGDPSLLTVKYKSGKPSGASSAEITNSPHVSVFRISFPQGASGGFVVLDFGKSRVDSWAALDRWTERSLVRIDDRTVQATIGEPGKPHAYYVVKFSVPCLRAGTIDSAGALVAGGSRVAGTQLGMFAQFEAPSVTVAVAQSFTGMSRAEMHLAGESGDFDTVRARCRTAWQQVLDRVQIDASDAAKRIAYSALYTIYANILDGSDGSCYSKYYPRPRSVSSSAYWQFIGGFQSCCWDNFRTVYPFLMLAYPEVMTDVVANYLCRYQRDGSMNGNICLFTGPTGDHENIRFSPVLVSQAYHSGIPADYAKFYAALKDNFSNDALFPPDFSRLGYLTQPATGGRACSNSLEFATSMHSMAMLAKTNNDKANMERYLRLSGNYANLWDSTIAAFRVKNGDGSWGAVDYKKWTWNPNPQGLFEGTTADWMFAVPHDPYGLIRLPGQDRFVERVVNYCLNDTWFNDYQYHYPYLLYYAGAANEAQRIIRRSWVPMFKDGEMFEEVRPNAPYRGSKAHYTSSAGWVICSMLGLYPMTSPAGQYVITSPSVAGAVIRQGGKSISVRATNNNAENIYVSSIRLDGKLYPSYLIPAARLAAGATIDLEMSGDPARGLGDLYVASSDGFVRSAELAGSSRLKCVIEAAVESATTQVSSRKKPSRILVDRKEDRSWVYDGTAGTATVRTRGKATIEVFP